VSSTNLKETESERVGNYIYSICGILFFVFAIQLNAEQPWTRKQIRTESSGGFILHPKPVAEQFRNPSSEKDENEFAKRTREIIAAHDKIRVNPGNTFFENEKRTYGYLMSQALGERGLDAIVDLQREDAQAKTWHQKTAGIDYYAAFTLKHQIRKYFYFGDMLEPEYRKRMYDGAKAWTSKDPLRRSHPCFLRSGPGWGPDNKDSWVDVRSTENLFLMRVTSVYLMAEETGNRETAATYKKIILDYTKALYRIGMGEWDSENYHGHSLTPLLNLYDFSKDNDVKLAAKACLDWMFAAGAIKYYRGGFNGPTKRDYNHIQPFGGSAPSMLWVHFGDCTQSREDWESDEVHLLTSAYRPPPAVMQLARKQFSRPVEIWSSKPHYTATTSHDLKSGPAYLETQYIGDTFQLGSLAGGTRPDKSDVNGFKIIVYDKKHGARTIQAVPGPDPKYVGSPQYQEGKVSGENRIAQDGSLAIWMVKDGNSAWCWVLSDDHEVKIEKEVTFVISDKTWIAIRPINTSVLRVDSTRTDLITTGKKPRFPEHRVLSCEGKGGTFCGCVVEIGDGKSFGSFAKFREHVLDSELNLTRLGDGAVDYQTPSGKWLGFHWNDDPHQLGVWRNGKRHDWTQHAKHLYQVREGDALIESVWGEGSLTIQTNDHTFECKVDESGKVHFENR